MKTVVHFKQRGYLPLTENWIYEQISRLRRYRPIVYTDRTLNLDLFPSEEIYAILEELPLPGRFLKRVWLRFFGYYPFLDRWLRRDQPDVVHAHFGDAGFAFLGPKSRLNLPLITTFYGYDMSLLPHSRPEWKARYRQLFDEGELFLAEGNHMKGSLVALGCPEAKIMVQHIGVDLDKIQFKPRVVDESQTIRILVAASFREKKGIPYAVEGFAKVRRTHPELPLQLTIIGDSTRSATSQAEKKRILDAIDRHNLQQSVRMLGYQPHAAMLEVASTHHVFLAPSVRASNGDSEGGAPVAITEMSASGMPILATNHCDIPEVVVDGKSGFLVPEKDTMALAEKLEILALNPGLWEVMGRHGRAHVEAEYNIDKQVARLEDIYDRLVGGEIKKRVPEPS